MSPATERVLAEGLTCSKQSFVCPAAERYAHTLRADGSTGAANLLMTVAWIAVMKCIWSIVAALGTSFLIAGSQLPRAETVVIDLTRWTPPDISTVGDDPFGKLVKYGHRLFTNAANEIGPAVSEQSVTEPPHFRRT